MGKTFMEMSPNNSLPTIQIKLKQVVGTVVSEIEFRIQKQFSVFFFSKHVNLRGIILKCTSCIVASYQVLNIHITWSYFASISAFLFEPYLVCRVYQSIGKFSYGEILNQFKASYIWHGLLTNTQKFLASAYGRWMDFFHFILILLSIFDK